MVHMVRQVENEWLQRASLLAATEVFEGVRDRDVVLEEPKLSYLRSCGLGRGNELAQLVDEVTKTLTAVYPRHAGVVCRPPWSRWKRHGFLTRAIVAATAIGAGAQKNAKRGAAGTGSALLRKSGGEAS
jgi:hypothetical protein